MCDDEAAILTLLVNAGIANDESYSPSIRLRALQIALETAIEIQTAFASILGTSLT